MPYTERSKPQVVLNKMTKAVYDSIEKDPDQLYAVTDADIYDLPVASADTLGGIKVGENLTIGEDGTLNAQAGSAEVIEMFDLDTATAQEIADAITASSGETTTAIEVISVMKYGFRKPDGSLINSFSNLRREAYNGNLPFEYKVDTGKMQNLPFLSRIYTQSTRATTVETSLYYANSMSKTNINFTADTEYNKFWYAYSNDLDDDTYAVVMGDYVSEDISQEGGIGVGFVMEDINGDLYMGNSQDETKKISPNEKELTQAEYDALSDEEKNNGTTYYITDAESGRWDNYSTAEQPIGTWIDGRTVYRKTAAFLNVQAVANGYKLFDFAPARSMPLDIKVTYNTSWDKDVSFFTHDALSAGDVRWFMANGQLRVNWGGNAWDGDYYVTVDYVKN